MRKAKSEAETVTLTLAQYERSLQRAEDAEDARDLRVAKATAGQRDYLPAARVKRILAGDHPARVWREHRGLSLAQLVARAGMQSGYLSEVETGKKPGSIRAYRALAASLGVTVDDLLPAA